MSSMKSTLSPYLKTEKRSHLFSANRLLSGAGHVMWKCNSGPVEGLCFGYERKRFMEKPKNEFYAQVEPNKYSLNSREVSESVRARV